jgi:hypothetical protein
MLDPRGRISLVANKNDALLWDASLLGCRFGSIKQRKLCDESLGFRILQLVR